VSGFSEAKSKNGLKQLNEACAQKIAQSEGKDWGSMRTWTHESYRDEAETVCHNCYVGGSEPQTQKDAFHNLLTWVVRHWMGEDYWPGDDWTVDRKKGPKPPTNMNGFTHIQQPLTTQVVSKCSMIPTKLRLSKIVTPFPVFEEHWDPNMVIALAEDQGGTLDVKMFELFCLTCLRYKAKVARALKMQNWFCQNLCKGVLRLLNSRQES